MTDELTKTTNAVAPLVPQTMDDMWRFATMIAKSGMTSVKRPDEAAFLVAYGLELGITPVKAVQSLHLIKGKVTMSADMMVSLCLRDDRCDYIEVAESTDRACTYRAKRKGRPEQTFTFSIEMARRAGLIKSGSNWQTYPEAMLKARAGSHIARQVFPDVVMGIYDPDEIRNIGTAEVIDPEPVEAEISEVEEEDRAELPRVQLEALAGPHWPEFYEALCVAAGREPPETMLSAVLRKLTAMGSDVERSEYMQAKIDEYLQPAEDDAVDVEFQPVGEPDPLLKSAVVMQAIDTFRQDDQGAMAVAMGKMTDVEKAAFRQWCADHKDERGIA